MKKYFLILFLVVSCAPVKNSVISPIQGKEGKKLGTMSISFESKNGYTKMVAISTKGEIFKGEVVGDKVESESYSRGYDEGESTSKRGRSKSRKSRSGSGSSIKYSSKATAMLISNEGNSMRCEFKMYRPQTGLAAGGVGECKISDGRVVPVSVP